MSIINVRYEITYILDKRTGKIVPYKSLISEAYTVVDLGGYQHLQEIVRSVLESSTPNGYKYYKTYYTAFLSFVLL